MVSLSIGYRTHAANMYLEQRVANWIILSVLAVGVPSGLCQTKTLYHEPFKQEYHSPEMIPQDALFGYSVTYQPVGTTGRLIVGAPKADNIGHVYTCDLGRQSCYKIVSNIRRESDISHNFWLGATVKAGSKFFLTCAPRLRNHEISLPNKIGTFSRCYYQYGDDLWGVLQAASMVSLPTAGKKFEDTQTSYGWSMDVGEDDTIAVGGPVGSGGRVMVYENNPINTPILIDTSMINGTIKYNFGRVMVYDSNNPINTPILIDTSMINGTIKYNFGYSIASGKFLTSTTVLKAISSTYGDVGKGKVVFFKKTTSNYEHIPRMDILDDELGSMFGAALCSAWIGSPQQSLLVGAPAASSVDGKTRLYNVGAVFIYSNIMKKQPRRAIFGQREGSCFGNAIITIDDLTGDGKDEVAISAPYEDEGRGAVYLYSGAELFKKDGEITWLQRIVGAAPEQNLGFSLGALQDYDQNGCDELAIGVPGNNSVVVLRCVNSVTIMLSTTFPSLESQARDISTRDSSFDFDVSMSIEYPPRMRIIDSGIAVTIVVNHPNATISGDKTYSYRVSLKDINQKSYNRKVRVQLPFGGDYVQDIAFEISAKPVIDPYGIAKFNPNLVTLSDKSTRSITRTVNIPVKSNLSLDVSLTMADGYVIGSTATENLTITISNDGYMAYGACAHVRIAGASVLLFPLGCTTDRDHFYCTALMPITKNKPWTAIITLDTKTMTSDSKVVDIRVKLLDHCVKAKGVPYEKKIKLKTDFEPVFILGKSDPQSVNISETMVHHPYFEHVYTITNNGITTWGELSCNITLPPHVIHSFPKGVVCEKTSELTAFCRIKKLHKQHKLTIGMEIPSYEPFDNPETRNVTIHSEIILQLGEAFKFQSINTVVVQVNVTVPLWIIIASAVVGLLILVLVAFALHECGFLQRKNKQKLEVLKEKVRRETIRRSENLRVSLTHASNPQTSDKRKLLKEEDEVASHTSDTEDRKETGAVSIDKDTQRCRYADNQELLNHLRKRNDNKVDEKGLTKAEIH